MTTHTGQYDANSEIVDFILGITYEIWEERGVDLIHQYFAPDCVIYALDGITRGADAVVTATWETLDSFPDRVLLAEDVICSGSRQDGYYSSHRLVSEMTNEGPTPFGPATGQRVKIRNISDCDLRDGKVVSEWLARDNLALVRQLGIDPAQAARGLNAIRDAKLDRWLASELDRLASVESPIQDPDWVEPGIDPEAFAWQVLTATWGGNQSLLEQLYAPYCVLHRNPLTFASGREAIASHYDAVRRAIEVQGLSVDHVACRAVGDNLADIAVRWCVSGEHAGDLHGTAATGNPLLVMGISHFRCVDGRIAMESTVFDDLSLIAQALHGPPGQ